MLTIHPLTRDGVARCLRNLRPEDADELAAAGIDDALPLLADALGGEGWSQELCWGDRPIAMFGCRPLPGGEVGVPWMLSTTDIEQADRTAIARTAVAMVRRMRAEYCVLTNIVHAANVDAIRFVEWLGFHVEPALMGPNEQFRQFYWRRDDV